MAARHVDLKRLNVSNNRLAHIEGLGSCPNLQYLNASNNRFVVCMHAFACVCVCMSAPYFTYVVILIVWLCLCYECLFVSVTLCMSACDACIYIYIYIYIYMYLYIYTCNTYTCMHMFDLINERNVRIDRRVYVYYAMKDVCVHARMCVCMDA